jgi:hypothetical protein
MLVDVNDVADLKTRAPDGRLWMIRDSDLSNLRLLQPNIITDRTRHGVAKIVRILERAETGERKRGASGHWAYDQAHFRNVTHVLRAERGLLKAMGVQS